MADHDCDAVLASVHELLEGELGPGRRRELAGRLSECGHCLEAIEFEVELKLAVQASCREDLPPGMLDRLRAVLAAERPGSEPGRPDSWAL